MNDCELLEKLDGSTLIISKYKGQLIVRTRGTVDATKLDNGNEIEGLLKSNDGIEKFFNMNPTPEVSLIFEWTSPANKIVLNYGEEPCLVLIGVINHKDYSLWPQDELDVFSILAHFRRPRRYKFNSIDEMIKTVEAFKGIEGICVYSKNGQEIHKVKGAHYLMLHRLKSELGSFERVVDFYFTLNRPNYLEFYTHVEKTIDHEVAEGIKGQISKICDGMKEVENLVSYMKNFVAPLSPLKQVSRRDAAAAIMQAYGQTNRSGMAFKLLDGKQLDNEDYKKLLYQIIKD